MLSYIIRKFFRVILILFCVVLVTFFLLHAIPGNPMSNFVTNAQRAMSSYSLDDNVLREINRRFGLDLPVWRQLSRYVIGYKAEGEFVCGLICGNLGPSISQRGRPIEDIIFSPPAGKTFWESQFGYSIRLVLFSSVIAILIGVPLGILGAKYSLKPFSRMQSIFLAGLVSIPNFVLGLLAVIVFASWLHISKVLPDWDIFSNWIIPAFVLAAMPMANVARVMQTTLENTQNMDYVRTAKAKGLTERRITLVHIMRNAIVPFIAYLGPTLVELFGGLFVVESLYGFPGFGRQYWMAVLKLDYPLILGLTLFYAAGIALVNMVIEIISEFLDPRIKEQNELVNP
jgi:oligopeptide transport system permease protein